MTRGDLEPLSPEMKNLMANERNFSPESAELRARVMARAARVGSSRAPVGSFWQHRARLLVAAALVTAFAAAAFATFRAAPRASEPRPGVSLPASGSPPVAARAPEPPPVAEPPPSPRKTEPRAESSEKGRVVAAPRRSSGDVSHDDSLELALLQRARAGIASGRFSIALEAIGEHERRFPSGRLREEREALRVRALSGLGRYDEARRAAKRFRERFPGSVLASGIEETIRPDP